MCGIVGYIGKQEAAPILLEGLRRLEYRGYDSAGIAVLDAGGIALRKRIGRIANLAELLRDQPVLGKNGICHTRWATHGAVTDANAHPHLDRSGALALVHNGVIENHSTLREALVREGHTFVSQTDTEVLAHLVGKHFDAADTRGETPVVRMVEAVRAALREVVGTYGIAIVHRDVPGVLLGARRGSPLVLGIGKGEHFLASDVSAIASHAREVVYLKDFDIAMVSADGFELTTLPGGRSGYEISSVEFQEKDVDKGEFPHFMLKEIYEQPDTIRDAMRGRLSREEASAKLGGLNMTNAQLRSVERVVLTGCGTAFHAALCLQNVDGDTFCGCCLHSRRNRQVCGRVVRCSTVVC